MKKTQIVIHLMPSEIEDFSTVTKHLSKASQYLETTDWISIYATLNLSPKLIDWEKSSISPQFFIDKFNSLKEDYNWANEIIFEIIDDNSILGTTSQKRKAIQSPYDQYIFLDCDIAFPEVLLKYVLETSYQVNGNYFVTPQTVKLWDHTWDVLVHDSFLDKEYGYERIHSPLETYSQSINDVEVINSPYFKFGCGWFTLYSKDILDFIGIPDWLGHYGPEDTFLMYASQKAISKNHDIKQYIVKGCYVSENYVMRSNPYKDQLLLNSELKTKFRQQAESQFMSNLEAFSC